MNSWRGRWHTGSPPPDMWCSYLAMPSARRPPPATATPPSPPPHPAPRHPRCLGPCTHIPWAPLRRSRGPAAISRVSPPMPGCRHRRHRRAAVHTTWHSSPPCPQASPLHETLRTHPLGGTETHRRPSRNFPHHPTCAREGLPPPPPSAAAPPTLIPSPPCTQASLLHGTLHTRSLGAAQLR